MSSIARLAADCDQRARRRGYDLFLARNFAFSATTQACGVARERFAIGKATLPRITGPCCATRAAPEKPRNMRFAERQLGGNVSVLSASRAGPKPASRMALWHPRHLTPFWLRRRGPRRTRSDGGKHDPSRRDAAPMGPDRSVRAPTLTRGEARRALGESVASSSKRSNAGSGSGPKRSALRRPRAQSSPYASAGSPERRGDRSPRARPALQRAELGARKERSGPIAAASSRER
jgi:hypothetical protein